MGFTFAGIGLSNRKGFQSAWRKGCIPSASCKGDLPTAGRKRGTAATRLAAMLLWSVLVTVAALVPGSPHVLSATSPAAGTDQLSAVQTPNSSPPLLASLDRSAQRILIFAPHPDDESLGVGGLARDWMLAGSQVWVAWATNGDANVGSAKAWFQANPTPAQWVDYGQVRQLEAKQAMAELGVPVDHLFFLSYPDQGLDDLWGTNWLLQNPWRSPYTREDHNPYPESVTPGAPYAGEAALRDFVTVLERVRPTLVFVAHASDTHPDHWATGAFATAALEAVKASGSSWASQTQLYEYLIHWNRWPLPSDIGINLRLSLPPGLEDTCRWESVDVSEETRPQKSWAINSHKSQAPDDASFRYLISFSKANELFANCPPAKWPAVGAKPVVLPNPWIGRRSDSSPLDIVLSRPSADLVQVDVALVTELSRNRNLSIRFYGITPQSASVGDLAITSIRVKPNHALEAQLLGLGANEGLSNALTAQVTARILSKEEAGGSPIVRVQIPVSLLRADRFLLGAETFDGERFQQKTPYRVVYLGPNGVK